MLADCGQLSNEGVVEIDLCPTALDHLDQAQRRALAHAADILLVGHAQHKHARTIEAASEEPVTRLAQPCQHMARHCCVDLAGKHDEASREPELACLPGQVERIDRDTMASAPGAGRE